MRLANPRGPIIKFVRGIPAPSSVSRSAVISCFVVGGPVATASIKCCTSSSYRRLQCARLRNTGLHKRSPPLPRLICHGEAEKYKLRKA